MPDELRELGDRYVKDEFRRHLKCTPMEAQLFMTEWAVSHQSILSKWYSWEPLQILKKKPLVIRRAQKVLEMNFKVAVKCPNDKNFKNKILFKHLRATLMLLIKLISLANRQYRSGTLRSVIIS